METLKSNTYSYVAKFQLMFNKKLSILHIFHIKSLVCQLLAGLLMCSVTL